MSGWRIIKCEECGHDMEFEMLELETERLRAAHMMVIDQTEELIRKGREIERLRSLLKAQEVESA